MIEAAQDQIKVTLLPNLFQAIKNRI